MTINIYHNYYANEQRKYLDPAFIPYDNTINENPRYAEYWLFLTQIYAKNIHKNATYTGLLSWKFNEKTKIAGRKFIQLIKDNPGFDVYFINPLPFVINSYAFKNVWLQGDFYHPSLLKLTQGILDKLNYKIDLKNTINDESTTLFCNYWVGNEKFWDKYIEFTKPIYEYLSQSITPEEKLLVSKTADKIINMDYTPFIFERLFSTILAVDKEIKSLPFKYSRDDLKRLSSEEQAAIRLMQKVDSEFSVDDKQLAIESIHTLIQRILQDRQDNLETHGDLNFQLYQKILSFLKRHPFIKKTAMYAIRTKSKLT